MPSALFVMIVACFSCFNFTQTQLCPPELRLLSSVTDRGEHECKLRLQSVVLDSLSSDLIRT